MEDVAVEINDELFNSFKAYFDSLFSLGYVKESDTNKLLIYSFIQEMLTEEMSACLSSSDMKYIEGALNCLYGSSCLITYRKQISYTKLFGIQDNDDSNE